MATLLIERQQETVIVQHGGTSAPGDLFVTHEQGLNILEEAAKAIADSPAVERAMAGSKAIIKSGD